MAVKPEVLDRETQVIALRREGLTFDQIAQRVGYADKQGAYAAYTRAVNRITAEDVHAIRMVEAERLDIATQSIWQNVLAGEIPAVNALLKIMDRRAKMFGLDMPVKTQVEVVTYDAGNIKANLAAIVAGLANSSTQSELASGTSTPEPVTD